MNPLLIVAAIAGGLALAGLEWRRPDRAFRRRRTAAAAAAVGSLALLAGRSDDSGRAEAGAAIVATEGATPSVVRRLADSAHAPIYVLARAGDARSFGAAARPTPDIAAIMRDAPSIGRLIVTGWGLDSAELADAGRRSLTFIPEPIPPGVATVRWSSQVPLGGRLVVRGSTTGVPAGSLIQLIGPEGIADTGRITPDSTFVLGVRPPAAAHLRYALRIALAGGSVVAETLGTAVVDRPPPSVLILDRAPSFESRYLEDWLRAAGGSLAVRTAISRGRYRTRYLNRSTADLSRLTVSALRSFDVVVLGMRTLAGLPPAERSALVSAVRDGGLGVVLRADDARPGGGAMLEGFSLAASGSSDRTSRLAWAGDSGGQPVGLAPLALGGDAGTRPLATDSGGRPVAAWRRQGVGAVAVTLATTPSRWRLSGETERFASYWSLLLGAVSRPPAAQWEAAGPAMVDRPLRLVRFGPDTAPAAIVEAPDARDSVFLAQDLIVPSRWEATYWPRTSGWHRIGGDSLALDFDVAATGWRTLEATALHRMTAERAAAITPSTKRNAPGGPRRIPAILLFGVFVGAAAALWSGDPRQAGR